MLPTAIIVFREVLEAALIVGIVMAASRGALGRGLWVSGGIAAGVLGACLVALFAATIAAAAQGMGQELFDAGILFAAVCMLGWHNVWMSSHGRELAANAVKLGNEVRSGVRPLWALAFVVALAVLTFVPFHVVHPVRIQRLRGLTVAAVVLGALLAIVAIAANLAPGFWTVTLLCLVAVYLIGIGFLRRHHP